ncbi:MAG: alkene reductase [Stenotrophomonas acidaminiphila]|nr:MAG: alkene reductase [Stenotrophomonas acidaminiphila]
MNLIREKLFTPATLGPMHLDNRIVMAPMTRSRAGADDVPTAHAIEYYRQRASAGLIISEGSQISPQAKGYPRTPSIYSSEQIQAWKAVTAAVHARGGRIYLQLWHVGRVSHPFVQPHGELPVGPSAIKVDGELFTSEGMKAFETPRVLDIAEIPDVVNQFRQGAENAMLAGFDGVEIHGANGYLIDQFLRDGANQRTDAYGGPVENRIRFLREVVEAVIPVFGASRTGIRLSPVFDLNSTRDSAPATTFGAAVDMLSEYGLAYLHVVELGDPSFDFQDLRRRFKGTYIANGAYTRERAIDAVETGMADFVSFGTPFIANPDLPERLAIGAPLNTPDPTKFYQREDDGYTDYPTLAA